MKHSGVEWIGEMPKEWRTIRFKYLHDGLNTGEAIDKEYWSSENDNKVFYTAGLEPIRTSYEDFPQWKYTEGNDLLLARNGTPYVYYPEIGACYTDHIIRAPLKKGINRRYVQYILQQSISAVVVETVSIATWSASLWNKQVITWPTVAEQQRIADYLDAKCAKIDALIAKQQEIIEKLKAYKLSVITEAVTKGLNPNVPMKDCGIEWIGVIPEQWRLSHIGNLAEIGAGGTPDRKKPEYWEDGTIRWMASGEINYEYVYDTAERITELGIQNSNAKLLPVNTVMLGLIGQGKTKGMTAILKTECACNQNLAYLIPNPDLLHYRYLFYCFKAMYHYIRGLVGESQAGIYQDFLKKQHIPLPNIEVQVEICDYLDRVAAAIDIYVVRREEQIKKLVDYKKSLIYEVVTGKREV